MSIHIKKKEKKIIDKFLKNIYILSDKIDPMKDYHWESLAYGFLLANNILIERARVLSFYLEDICEKIKDKQ